MFSLRKKFCYGGVLILGALLFFGGCDNPTTNSGGSVFTVLFDSRGGDSTPDTQYVASGGKVASPRAVVKDGDILDGWYESPDGGGAPWDFDADTVTGDLTLHAKWSPVAPNAWVVSFDANGGSPAPADQGVAKNAPAAAPSPVPSKEGYILNGWYRDPEFTGAPWNFNSPVTASFILYAKWSAVEAGKVVVVFDARGGSPVPAQRAVDRGSLLSRPPDPARTGHDFGGWALSPDGGAAWDFAVDTVEEPVTLYAKWTVKSYAVTFDSRGGDAVAGQNVAHGSRIDEPAAPANDPLFLEGWYKETGLANKWDFATDTVSGPVTLYARWVAVPPGQFLVTFRSQGGSAVDSQFVADGGKALKPEDPTQENFVFDAWYKETGLTNKWDFDTDTVAAATILYAGWTPLWTVTFNTQQGSPVDPVSGVKDGDPVAKPEADPTRPGYSFGGWHKEVAGTNVWDFDTDVVVRNTVIYAKWIPLYTVTFDTGDGSKVAPLANVLDGAHITRPGTNPTLLNCVFDDWYKEAAYTNKWDFAADTVAANTTLYARWTVTVTFAPNGGTPAPAAQTNLTRGSRAVEPETPAIAGKTFMGWYKEAAYTNEWDFAEDTVAGNTILYAKWDFIETTNISAVPPGIIGESLALGSAVVEPANASFKEIEWTVTDAGGTGVSKANDYKPTNIGTVKLTATVKGGGAAGDYTKPFDVPITRIRKVEGIIGIEGMTASGMGIYPEGAVIDLGKARVTPPNATVKVIGWTVKTPGAGVEDDSFIVGDAFTLTKGGTLTLTATVIKGDESAGNELRNYTEDFVFFVDRIKTPAGVGMGEDTTIRLFASDSLFAAPGDKELLPADEAIRVGAGASYYISINDTDYSDTVWTLNGTVSSVTGTALKLNTEKPGTLVVRVSAKKSGGGVDDGVYTFIIE